MPILDWTRTDLAWQLSNGSRCMRFDLIDFVIFDVYLLKRSGAVKNYSNIQLASAEKRFQSMSKIKLNQLTSNIIHGLPGATENYSIEDIKKHIASYSEISEKQLRKNFIEFLSKVVPVAEELGIRLCCHPDDPPFSLLGLIIYLFYKLTCCLFTFCAVMSFFFLFLSLVLFNCNMQMRL